MPIKAILLILIAILSFQNHAVVAIDDVSTDLDIIRVLHYMPGLSALALKGGEIVGQGAAGFRRQGNPSPLLLTDPVNIGSCSKWMTATIAGRLVDRRLISWTTQVHECFPNYGSFNSVFRNTTLEQLLAHRAGIQQSTTFFGRHLQQLLAQTGTFREIRHWTAETVMKDAPEVKPGDFLYANQGYAVAAAMMEFVTNQDWESLLQEHVFTPLQMTTCSVGQVYDDAIPPKAPVGHDLPAGQGVPIPRPSPSAILLHNDQAATGPGGYIACTLHDWSKFLHAHVTYELTHYLSTETAAKLKRSYIGVEGYGLGVYALNRTWATPGQALAHSGDIFGQDTVFWMTPGRDLIVVVYTNCRSIDTSTGLALDNAAGMLIGKYAGTASRSHLARNDPIVLGLAELLPNP